MTAQHLQALPAPILYNTSKGYCMIEERISVFGYPVFDIYKTNGDFWVYYPRILSAWWRDYSDHRAHMEGFPPLFIECSQWNIETGLTDGKARTYALIYNFSESYRIYPNQLTASL
jgi:hypothetical protein